MAIGSGIGASLGIATETTFNTGVTVTRFYEFTSESTNYNKNASVGMGLRAGGLLPRSQRRVITTFDATGSLVLDLPTRGLGLLLAHSMGSFPTKSGSSFTFTLGDVAGKFFTTQVGVPQYGGTVTPKTLTGCKISNFELSAVAENIATGTFDIDAAGLTTATSLATPSYSASGSVFHFAQGAVTLDGSAVANIKEFTLSVDNVLKTDRYNLGTAGAKAEQTINGFRKISGTIKAEFTDTALLAKFLADTTAALSLTLTASASEVLQITVSAVKFDGNAPQVSGPEVIDIDFSFEGYDNGTDAPLTIVYTTPDTAL
jgi:hypothetical protein